MGDTSLVQLRDAIDILIGKLDEKIEASVHNASCLAPASTNNYNQTHQTINKHLLIR